jgi:hypothetical protein
MWITFRVAEHLTEGLMDQELVKPGEPPSVHRGATAVSKLSFHFGRPYGTGTSRRILRKQNSNTATRMAMETKTNVLCIVYGLLEVSHLLSADGRWKEAVGNFGSRP